MTPLPEHFAAQMVRRYGAAGERWIAALPALVDGLCAAWGLEREDAEPEYGFWGVVYAVRAPGRPAVLKLSWPDDDGLFAQSVRALDLWAGRGAVRLLRADHKAHALLLERLDAGTPLTTVEIAEALAIAGPLLRRLAIPAPDDLPKLGDVARRDVEGLTRHWVQLGRPVPAAIIEGTQALTDALLPGISSLLVHCDLHWGNVLRARREPWLAIDPQVLSGDLEYGLSPLLWWRLEEIEARGGLLWALDTLVETAALDPWRARAWTAVRTVHYWLWGLETGLTIDPPRCERIVQALGAHL